MIYWACNRTIKGIILLDNMIDGRVLLDSLSIISNFVFEDKGFFEEMDVECHEISEFKG